MDLKKKLTGLRAMGLDKFSPLVKYSLMRDRLDRKYLRSRPASDPVLPGRLLEAPACPAYGSKDPPGCGLTGKGLRFRFEAADLEVLFLAADLVRISWSPGLEPLPYALDRLEWPEETITLSRLSGGWAAASSVLEVIVYEDGGLLFAQPGGAVLRRDLPPVLSRQSEGMRSPVSLRTQLAEDERIFGLGERSAPFNRRGRSYGMWNMDAGGSYGPGDDPLYLSIPIYLSLHSGGSYLAFYENSFRGEISAGRILPGMPEAQEDWLTTSFEGGMLRYYVIPGPPDAALERLAELTGRAPLPPRWALGYHQCRWGYRHENDIRQVVQGFIEHDMPVSAIHLDIDYMRGYRVFTVDKERFPDIPALSAALEEQGIKLVAILNPGIKIEPGYEVYENGLRQGVFCLLPGGKLVVGQVWPGECVYPDFTSSEVRAWWGQFYRFFHEIGIAGIWHDMNEPTSLASWGDMALPLAARHDMEGRGGDHLEGHNLYGLQMNQAGYEAMRKLRPGKRPWLISRSGWAGLQRYAWNWTGDTETSWAALRMTVSTILGLGLSGLPFNGPDVGGYSGDPEPELYVRWFQLATFLPYFRTHSSSNTKPREPWVYGEPYTSILREFLKLRYRLMPYFYTLAWQAVQKGAPPVRPLFWPDASDPALWDVEDAFLLGNSLLVAPVLEPGAARRELRLPEGGWYDFWDDRLFHGSVTVSLDACLERIPVLARAGSILPMEEQDRLLLRVYPDSQGKAGGDLYSDEGDGFDPGRIDSFALETLGEKMQLTCTGRGDYPFPYNKITVKVHGSHPVTVESGPFDRLALS